MNIISRLRRAVLNNFILRVFLMLLAGMILLNLLLGLLLYQRSKESLKHEIIQSNRESIKKIALSMDDSIEYALSLLLWTGVNRDLEELVRGYDEPLFLKGKRIEAIQEILAGLTGVNGNGIISRVVLYIEEKNLILDQDKIDYSDMENGSPWQIHYDELKKKNERYKYYSYNEEDKFYYMVLLPLTAEKKQGAILMFLDKDAIHRSINKERSTFIDRVDVFDNEMKIVNYDSEKNQIDQEGIVTEYHSQRMNWTYRSLMEADRLDFYLRPYKSFFILLSLSIITLGIGFSFFISNLIYKPLRIIREKLQLYGELESTKEKGDIDKITESLSLALSNRQSLENIIHNNRSLLKASMIRKLLDGTFAFDQIELERRCDIYNLSVNLLKPFLICSLILDYNHLTPLKNGEVIYIGIIDFIEDFLSRNSVDGDVVLLQEGSIFIMLSIEDSLLKVETEILSRIQSDIKRIMNIKTTLLVSQPANDWQEMPDLYAQINRMKRITQFSVTGEILFFDENYSEPVEESGVLNECKENLYDFIRAGDMGNSSILFERWHKIAGLHGLIKTRVQFFYIQLLGYLELIVSEEGLDGSLFSRQREILMSDFATRAALNKNDLKEYVLLVTQTLSEKKNATKRELVNRALDFIENNYQNDISLDDTALSIGISSPYFSKIFREMENEGFKEHISQLRIKKSIEILKQGDMSINEIWKKVGFTNVSTFYRVFKKYSGKTPDQFR